MDKGERIMGPIPGGIISTSTGPVDPEAEVVVEKPSKKKAQPVEEVVEVVEEELPEAEADDL
jgi:hypothetical protein